MALGRLTPIRAALACVLDGATAMRNYGIRQMQTTARVGLICPDCGQENWEFTDTLCNTRTYDCNGEGCNYIFTLASRRRTDFGKDFIESCKRFYAAFYATRGQGVR